MPGADIHIEGYEIIRRIARGGMAIVYLGRELELDREVAIKVMDTNLEVLGEDLVARFRREAQITASTSHPNIVALHSFGLVEGRPYITMEYLKGGTLRQRLKKAGTLGVDEVLTLGKQIASALEVLHGRGVVHRDLKPDNILFHEVGHAVLTDFGIAKLFEANTQLTSAGMTLGTYGYISPEQAVGETIDGRSDIYSLGVILYEALVGSLPTRAESTAAFLYALVHAEVSALPEQYAGLQPLFDRALARASEDRYADIAEFRQAIEQASRALLLGNLDISTAIPVASAAAADSEDHDAAAVEEAIEEATNIVPTPIPQHRSDAARSSSRVPAAVAVTASADPGKAEETTVRTEPEEPEETTVRTDPEVAADAAGRPDLEPPEETTIRVGDDAEGDLDEAARDAVEPARTRDEPILSEARPSSSRSSRQIRTRRHTGTSGRARSTGTHRAGNASARTAPIPLIAGGAFAALALAAGIGWWALSGGESTDSTSAAGETVAEAREKLPAEVPETTAGSRDDRSPSPLPRETTAEATAPPVVAAAPSAFSQSGPSDDFVAATERAMPAASGAEAAEASQVAAAASPRPAQQPLLTAQLASELSDLLLPPVTTDELLQALDALAEGEPPAAAFNASTVAQPLRDQVNLFIRTQLRERAYLGLEPAMTRLSKLDRLALLSEDSLQRLGSHAANLAAEAALQFRMGYLSAPEDNNLLLTLNNIFSIDPTHEGAVELKQRSAERLAGVANEAWLAGSGALAGSDRLSSAAIEYMEQALQFNPDAPDARLWQTMLENWQTSVPAAGEEAQSGGEPPDAEAEQAG